MSRDRVTALQPGDRARFCLKIKNKKSSSGNVKGLVGYTGQEHKMTEKHIWYFLAQDGAGVLTIRV